MTMETPLTHNIHPGQEPPGLKGYERAGGYQGLRKALGSMTPQEVVDLVKASRLRGCGGAGFPTGLKWSLVPRAADGPGTWWPTRMKWNLAPSRTVSCWKATPTSC